VILDEELNLPKESGFGSVWRNKKSKPSHLHAPLLTSLFVSPLLLFLDVSLDSCPLSYEKQIKVSVCMLKLGPVY
jgi:hypothetical protein